MDQNDRLPTVMIVEDFDDTRQMLAQWLATQNFRVVQAADGWEAVKVAVRERPGLILMDLNLPVLDGVEVTCLLREHEEFRDVSVVAITAHDTTDSRADASEVACNEYVTKPIDFDRLERIINRLLPV